MYRENHGTPAPKTSPQNLEELQNFIANSPLPQSQRKKLSNATQSIGDWLQRPLVEISTSPKELSLALIELKRRRIPRISSKRRTNVTSNLRQVLEVSGICSRLNSTSIPKGPWTKLYTDFLDSPEKSILRPFAKYCAANDIIPSTVSYEEFEAWDQWKEENLLRVTSNHKKSMLRAIKCWNVLVTQAGTFELCQVDTRRKRPPAGLINHLLPASFLIDLVNFKNLRGAQITRPSEPISRYHEAFQRSNGAPLSATKVEHCVSSVKLAAKTAIALGIKQADDLRTLSDVLTVEIASKTVEQAENRNGPSEYLLSIAKDLRCVAKRWTSLSQLQETQWKELIAGISNHLAVSIGHHRNFMTEKNRTKLLKVLEDKALERLISFPRKTLNTNEEYRLKQGTVTYNMALDVCCAVAVAILLTLPLRRGNLCRLKWKTNVSTAADDETGFLSIPGNEVKNKRPLTAILPKHVCHLLWLYREHYWPVLHPKDSYCPFLFPTRDGRHRAAQPLADMIARRIKEATDLEINVHLFRHIVATLAIQEASKSGEISHARSIVEGLLGSSPGSNVSHRYAELTTTIAADWFQRNVTAKFLE